MNNFKKYLVALIFSVVFIPTFVFASDDNDFEILSENTKYFKTITYSNVNSLLRLNALPYSESFEVSKEEYELANENSSITLADYSGTTETTYKKMTTTIASNGNYYRYKVVLNWKNIPSTRSYDIIAIGFYSNLRVNSSLNFKQEYCYSSGSCSSSTTNYPQTFDAGAGTTFKLPTGDLSSLKQTLYFDVAKEVNSTIISQGAYGDYSHATSSISLTNAKKYTVNKDNGIILNSSVSSYYDSISVARASWSGSW